METLKDARFIALVLISIVVVLLTIAANNYTLVTKWGRLAKASCEESASRLKTKIQTQYNYSRDMKNFITSDISVLYEKILRQYVKDKSLKVTEDQIKQDVSYYILLTSAINEECEDIALDRYILNNDLYRYKKNNDWTAFQNDVSHKFMTEGTTVLLSHYNDHYTIMPVRTFLSLASKDIYGIVKKHTNNFLDGLKRESELYHNAH